MPDYRQLCAELAEWCLDSIGELSHLVGIDETQHGVEFKDDPQRIAIELAQRLVRIGHGQDAASIDIPSCTNARIVVGILDKCHDDLVKSEAPAPPHHSQVAIHYQPAKKPARRGRKPDPERDEAILQAVEDGLESQEAIGERFGGITRSAVSKACSRARKRRRDSVE